MYCSVEKKAGGATESAIPAYRKVEMCICVTTCAHMYSLEKGLPQGAEELWVIYIFCFSLLKCY